MVDCQGGKRFRDLQEYVHGEANQQRMSSDFILIRLPVDLNKKVTDLNFENFHFSDGHDLLISRIGGIPAYLLGSHDFIPYISDNFNKNSDCIISMAEIPHEALIESLRISELSAFAENGHALFLAPRGSKFRAPSGEEREYFLRVGNIQADDAAVGAVFFWLLPHLRKCKAILAETWSISTIAHNAASSLWRYSDQKGDIPRVGMMSSYIGEDNLGRKELLESVEKLHSMAKNSTAELGTDELKPENILFLVSASQSGRTIQNLKQIILEMYGKNVAPNIVTIYKLGEAGATTNGVVLCDLSEMLSKMMIPNLQLDSKYKSSIKIDESAYFPMSPMENEIEIRLKQTEINKGFFDRYRGTGTLQVHRTYRGDGLRRHHGIYIDVMKLIGSECFVAKLEKRLNELKSLPAVIVFPNHECGTFLAERAREFFWKKSGRCIQAFSSSHLYFGNVLSSHESQLLGCLQKCGIQDSILIVDDVLITGSRISSYMKNLRGAYGNRPVFEGRIDCVIGVARPEGEDVWKQAARMFEFRSGIDFTNEAEKHQLVSVEELWLPNLDETECPWCVERDSIDQILQKLESGDDLELRLYERRANLVKEEDEGLEEGLFWKLQGEEKLSFTKGSLFVEAPATEAEVFVAVAAALQQKRHLLKKQGFLLGRAGYPITNVLNHEEYLYRVFTDSLLRFCFFRAARRTELVHVDDEREGHRSSCIVDLLTKEDSNEFEIAAEVVYQCLVDKVSIKPRDQDTAVERLKELGLGDYLKLICKNEFA